MIALLLNSGLGSRMGDETREHPKCLCPIGEGETILSWQVKLLERFGVTEAVVTTGHLAETLTDYIRRLDTSVQFRFVHNPRYRETNYIYSMYLARELLKGDVLSLHGDLVLHPRVMEKLLAAPASSVAVDAALPLPEKDFKAQLSGGRVRAIGIDRFGGDCVACQPAYKWLEKDFQRWMAEITRFIGLGEERCYAENAFNAAWEDIPLHPLDVGGLLCSEIDNQEDRKIVSERFRREVMGA